MVDGDADTVNATVLPSSAPTAAYTVGVLGVLVLAVTMAVGLADALTVARRRVYSILHLRSLDLDVETLGAIAEVMVAIMLPKVTAAVEERVREAVAKRDRQWKAKLTRARRP